MSMLLELITTLHEACFPFVCQLTIENVPQNTNSRKSCCSELSCFISSIMEAGHGMGQYKLHFCMGHVISVSNPIFYPFYYLWTKYYFLDHTPRCR